MKKVLLVDDFLSETDFLGFKDLSKKLIYQPSELGEVSDPGFPLIVNNADKVFSEVLGSKYRVVRKESGFFRKPIHNIHFETFNTNDDWVFINVMKQTTFNLFIHNTGVENAYQSINLNFANFTEWNYTTNILLEENQGLFFRPWLFHSIQGGLIHYYKLTK